MVLIHRPLDRELGALPLRHFASIYTLKFRPYKCNTHILKRIKLSI
jgi:hypothetical protein